MNSNSSGRQAHSLSRWMLLTLVVLGLASCTQWTEEQRKRQSLPDFKFEEIYGGEFKRSDLPESKPVTIVYYDPDCSHCVVTIESIVQHLDGFAGNTLALISPADRTKVIPFLADHGLLKREGVRVALCTTQEFLDTFGSTETPTTLFYASDWDLKMAYKGPVSPQRVLEGLAAVK